MLTYKNIIKEDDPKLKMISEKVAIPLSSEDMNLLDEMNTYLVNGYDEEFSKANDIRPGVGLAAPQTGVLKQMFVILAPDEKGNIHHYGIINPKIVSHSEEKAYLVEGEGCLSVERTVDGFIHRHKRITADVLLYDFDTRTAKETKLMLEDYISIVFQHEYDHLSGILFVDRINKTNPFFIPENSKPIIIANDEPEKVKGE